MSAASQFFPSGSSGTSTPTPTIRTNILLVGGGAGGSPSPGCIATPVSAGVGGGGGGGGQVYQFTGFKIVRGTQITVTVGSGGAASSDGGSTSICSSSQDISYTARGGNGNPTPIPCANVGKFYNLCSLFPSGGGKGGSSRLQSPGGCTPLVSGSCAGLTYCGAPFYAPSPSPAPFPFCINTILTDTQEYSLVYYGSSGGSPSPDPFIKNLGPYGSPGAGGHGGGGAAGGGGSGTSGCSSACACPIPGCDLSGRCAGNGGGGGSGYPIDLFGPGGCYGLGGGGGGGNYLPASGISAPLCPSACPAGFVSPAPVSGCRGCYGGLGGPSPNGGCGGCGGVCFCSCPSTAGCDATANTGGGGGGGGFGVTCTATGGNGGSGVAIIQYPTTFSAVSAPARPGSTDCSPSTPGYYTYRYNGPGSITLP